MRRVEDNKVPAHGVGAPVDRDARLGGTISNGPGKPQDVAVAAGGQGQTEGEALQGFIVERADAFARVRADGAGAYRSMPFRHESIWHGAHECVWAGPHRIQWVVMGNVALPDRLRSPFVGLADCVARVFPEGAVALGGGSMLEAWWSHRISTDLDPFVAPRNLQRAFEANRGYLYPLLLKALEDAGASVEDEPLVRKRGSVFLTGQWADGTPWSLATMHYSDPDHPMFDAVEETGIRAGGLVEIIMGKIVGRAHSADKRSDLAKQPIPIRDCYDVCVCAARAPDALPAPARRRIATNFHDAPKDLHLLDAQRIVKPAWAVDLAGVAARIGEAVATGDLGRIPVASSLGSTPKDVPRRGERPEPAHERH